MSRKNSKKERWNQGHTNSCSLEPMNEKQRQYISAIRSNPTVISCGPAGTGKSFISTILALQHLVNGQVDKIVICRPLISVGQSAGLLPGTLEEKLAPWLKPILEIIKQKMGRGWLESALNNENIIVEPFEQMQGRTFDNTFIILDEAQNCSEFELKMFLSRLGTNTKAVIDGDLEQKSLKASSGLKYAIDAIEKYDLPVPIVKFGIRDIVRSDQCLMWIAAFKSLDEGSDDLPEYVERMLCQTLNLAA